MLIWLTSEYWMTWRSTAWWKRTYEGLRGALCFTVPILRFPWSLVFVWCLLVGGCCVCFVCFFSGKLAANLIFSRKFPVVDRPRLVLVRQCRKKNLGLMRKTATVVTMRAAIGQKKVSKAATWFGWSLLFEFFRRCFLFVCCLQCYSDRGAAENGCVEKSSTAQSCYFVLVGCLKL